MHVEHVHSFSSQADADAVFAVPVDTGDGPMTLESVMVYLSAVGGSPTDVTLDVNFTDGTETLAPIAAQSIGTAAGTVRLEPTESDKVAGNQIIPAENPKASSPAYWRYTIDFNFTGGSSPTVTGTLVVRFRK